jgi:hypothetical protein
MEKTGHGHRIRQALSRAHVAHSWRFCKCGRGTVCKRGRGRECKSFRRCQFRCVCYIVMHLKQFLKRPGLERHDQHDQTRIHAESLLLGASERPSTGHPRRVCAFVLVFALPFVRCSRHVSSEQNSGAIRLYDGRGDEKPLETVEKLHRFPIHLMTVCLSVSLVIAA